MKKFFFGVKQFEYIQILLEMYSIIHTNEVIEVVFVLSISFPMIGVRFKLVKFGEKRNCFLARK